MKYLLLIYSNPENWEHPMFLRNPEFLAMPVEERDELTRQSEALHREITESGELVVAAALADPTNTRSIRVRDGFLTTTDGPYVETKEQMAGYIVVDCESLERASEIAARIPDARFAAVEVHPIMDMPDGQM
ncbi:YciI family protein [Actinomadura sp. HBU206391]|uniref:YciI family protein n=1 Tax=Actinomadura sp. HBU206391 TaxID=2731692 RepID=UPI00164F6FE9|nr:YciI family protein [Actinomadura sp. HBU206391]MBC6459104.1 YciI family protein [Actinomadura sp. HBU206391]